MHYGVSYSFSPQSLFHAIVFLSFAQYFRAMIQENKDFHGVVVEYLFLACQAENFFLVLML